MQERAWGEVKGLIASGPVIAYYKISKPSEVQCDNSQAGLGVALMQGGHHCLCEPSVNED